MDPVFKKIILPSGRCYTQEESAAALGELIMAFQALENAVIKLLAAVTDLATDVPGTIIASQLSFRKITEILEALCRHRTTDSEVLKRVSELSNGCLQLEQKRNTYVHSFYDLREADSASVVYERIKNRIKKGKGFIPDYELFDPENLSFDIEEIMGQTSSAEFLMDLFQEKGVVPMREDCYGQERE